MGFSQELKAENQEVWDKILAHRFIKELGEGTLPMEKFTYYVQQDYLYLIDFARCIGLAASKAEDIESMRRWAQMMDGCLSYETEMLEAQMEKLGITRDKIREARKAPTNTAYINHLLRVAYSGTVVENVAALLPCMWTYLEVGEVLASIGGYMGHPFYEDWCTAYGSEEYASLVQLYIDLVDMIAVESGRYLKDKMREHFRVSMKYEYMFWDMAYNMEKWVI